MLQDMGITFQSELTETLLIACSIRWITRRLPIPKHHRGIAIPSETIRLQRLGADANVLCFRRACRMCFGCLQPRKRNHLRLLGIEDYGHLAECFDRCDRNWVLRHLGLLTCDGRRIHPGRTKSPATREAREWPTSIGWKQRE